MARLLNSFALLGDEEDDDLMTLAANVAGKTLPTAPAEKKPALPQLQKNKSSESSGKFPSKPLPSTGSARGERGRGRNSLGLARAGPGRDEGGGPNSYYQKSGGEFDGPKGDDSVRGRGRERGHGHGRGRGRGQERVKFYEEHSFRNDNNQGFGGNENYNKRGQGDESWDHIEVQGGKVFGNENQPLRNENQSLRTENQSPRNENRSYQSGSWFSGEERGYKGERRGFRGREGRNYGGHDGPRFGRGEEQNEPMNEETEERQEQIGDSNEGTGRDVSEPIDVPKNAEAKQVVSEGVSDKKVTEEEEKEMTLDEYEKLLSEKRKALEVLKTEERKVVLDKDFEFMQLIDKKKENEVHFVKLKSEKDKLKKDSIEKEEKTRKSVHMSEFLRPVAGGERYGGRGRRGRGRGERHSSISRFGAGFSGHSVHEAEPDLHIEDTRHFPLLGATVQA
ncbi:RGG repeats nuclear RNA binding protein A-like [Aristolochia californica]|uniref:RGG repeats nuclear RNA binding protein A-like n=1 Tax=Aristolochia californica TaxID=171875 RepID=UPI0035DD9E69